MRNKDGTFDKRSKAGKELEAARKEMEAEMEAKYAPKENYSDSAKNISQEQTTYFDTYIFQNKFLIVPLTIILLIVTMGQLVKVEKLKKSLIISTTILSLLFSLGTLLFISLPIIGFNPKYGVYLSLILGPISYLMAKSHFASK